MLRVPVRTKHPFDRARNLTTGGLRGADGPEQVPGSDSMRLFLRWMLHRRVLLVVVSLVVLASLWVSVTRMDSGANRLAVEAPVDPAHKKLVHQHVGSVLQGDCRPHGTRKGLLARLPSSSQKTRPFLWSSERVADDLLLYPLPFGIKGVQAKVERLIGLFSDGDLFPRPGDSSGPCRRCVVVGNGGILKGLELGALIDRFDVVIRLNSGPLGPFSADVGNRTSIRMSYPESTPLHWTDTDPHMHFVAVLYKVADISWTSAMINKLPVSLFDWLSFWKNVPDQIPVKSSRFRLLNPQVIKEVALDLLQYPPPTFNLWGWDQNIPTLGVSALNLASLLCDEVNLAGFGYNLSQQRAPLHYYDQLPMSFMETQDMHNVNRETEFLKSLIQEGTLTDLTGGIHCTFCPS